MKTLLLCCVAWVIACSDLLAAFPTEEDVQRQLTVGMSPQQVVTLFGTPGTGTPEGVRDQRVFSYLSPIGRRTRDEEGYVGFKVFFENDRLTSWRPIRAKPSYDPDLRAREYFVPVVWYWALLFVGGFIFATAKAFRRGLSEHERMLEAYASRTIRTRRLPPEFRFITNDTTLQEVMERIGPSSRVLSLIVDEESAAGYGTVEREAGRAAILIHEYDLPYRAAIIVMPEYPFEPENRIRAVFYRPPLRDEE